MFFIVFIFFFRCWGVISSNNQYNFFGINDVALDLTFFDLRDASKAFDDPASVIFTDDTLVTPGSTAVSAPASAALLMLGFAGLMLRRRQAV